MKSLNIAVQAVLTRKEESSKREAVELIISTFKKETRLDSFPDDTGHFTYATNADDLSGRGVIVVPSCIKAMIVKHYKNQKIDTVTDAFLEEVLKTLTTPCKGDLIKYRNILNLGVGKRKKPMDIVYDLCGNIKVFSDRKYANEISILLSKQGIVNTAIIIETILMVCLDKTIED